jgi:hypothetical protein
LDWRLAQYLNRQGAPGSNSDIVCRVARAGDLSVFSEFGGEPQLELGPAPIQISGAIYEVVVAKIAINLVMRRVVRRLTCCPKYCAAGSAMKLDFPGVESELD